MYSPKKNGHVWCLISFSKANYFSFLDVVHVVIKSQSLQHITLKSKRNVLKRYCKISAETQR